VTLEIASDPVGARDAIAEGLTQFNEGFLGPRRFVPVAITAKDDEGATVGGATGAVRYDRLVVDMLWVAEAYRGKGLGSKLLRAIEDEGRRLGAVQAFLDTFTFQAAPFYERFGYREIARIPDFFDGYDRIYMMKPSL
jgi:GNAT superfamily N-acetyltransferase